MFSRLFLQASTLLSLLYTAASAQNACNNSPDLCNRAYNNITHLGAHDSPFLRNAETSFSTSGNHYYNTTIQLDAGVRLLSAQIHKSNDSSGAPSWHLCHSSCDLLDAGTLESWLSSIKTWMDKNTNDVVTLLLVNSDNAPASALGPIFSASGLDKLAYTPPSTTTVPQIWPSLDALIGNQTRLMTFVANLPEASSQYPFLMDEFSFIFENAFENINPGNFSCTPDRPSTLGGSTATAASSGKMFLQNHFLYENQLFGIQSPNETYANVTNAETGFGSLGESVKNCTAVYGKPPSFVLVDFFNVGPAMDSVDVANGVAGSVMGRKSVSAEKVSQSTSAAAAAGGQRRGSLMAVVLAVGVAVAFGS